MQREQANAKTTGRIVSLASKRTKARARIATQSDPRELDTAQRFVERNKDRLRYCVGKGGWLCYDGRRWAPDTLEQAREAVKAIADELRDEAAALSDDELWRHAKRVGSAKGIDAILALARSDPRVVVSFDAFDADPWVLNCANGTVDLRTGQLRPHSPTDLISRISPVRFDAKATAPRFESFLHEIQPDPEVRAYLARLFGCAAVGLVREHVLGVLWGPGANGKSVLADVASYVLGDYARPGASTLIVGAHNDSHPTDVAGIAGTRLVLVHETKRGASFDASKVKLLTGGDRLTARFMRGDFFDFAPSHTLVMLSNYRPQADATDGGLWRRLQLVGFNITIPEEQRDPELTDKLRNEASGVLRWIVEGAREWQRIGLSPPRAVREQTAAYRSAEDAIGQFIEERCVTNVPEAKVQAGALYQAFEQWCESTGIRPVRGNDFAMEITGRGFERTVRSGRRFYGGIGLLADKDDR